MVRNDLTPVAGTEIEIPEILDVALVMSECKRKAVLKGINGEGIRDFSDVDLSGADLSGLFLCKINFSGANLRFASFKGSVLEKVSLDNADITSTDFSHARLDEVVMTVERATGSIWENTEIINSAVPSRVAVEIERYHNSRGKSMTTPTKPGTIQAVLEKPRRCPERNMDYSTKAEGVYGDTFLISEEEPKPKEKGQIGREHV